MTDEQSFIKASGGLFTSHFINQMCENTAHASITFLHASDYQLAWNPDSKFTEAELTEYLTSKWDELLLKWNTYWSDLEKMSISDARRFWIRPLLEVLGFELVYIKNKTEISSGIRYPLSHKGWHTDPSYPLPPVIHIIHPQTDIDDRTEERRVHSAHAAVQMYLNSHDERWSIVTNGKKLRILRDFYHTTVQGYIEFDIDAIFFFRRYSDFVALFRFCHASRFVRNDDGNCPLDAYFEQSSLVGETIGHDLQRNVRKAIESLGNGFITENYELLAELSGNAEKCKVFYSDLLKVIYRIIFMLYAEQRGLLVTDKCESLFLSEYSITSLRNRVSELADIDDNYADLWDGLTVTFSMLKDGVEELGVPAFNGMLFDNSDGVILSGKKCRNTGVIQAIRYLTVTEVTKKKGSTVRQSISYGDISVEEIGGIYEGLLEYIPMITSKPLEIEPDSYPANSFVLNPIGMDRKKTGSYYTNPELIEALIQSALNPVIDSKLTSAGTDAKSREKALLSIRVCDPACGSGAFLIAATNRLGFELAKIRTGSDIPSEHDVRIACRDALSNCIYGVDINPMSVELAKVSLWINALVKGKPLNFLDNHIQCGNSLIGATRQLLDAGIPDGAFSRSNKEEKVFSSQVIRRNKNERQNLSLDAFRVRESPISGCALRFAEIGSIAENSPVDVHKKESEYRKVTSSYGYLEEKLICDLWCSAFFWDLDDDSNIPVEQREFPTYGVLNSIYNDSCADLSSSMKKKVRELAKKHQFFHWHLTFPDVFDDERKGFDCIIGNPPWEKIKIQEKEFFVSKDEKVANAENSSKRSKMIQDLKKSNPALHAEFLSALRDAEKNSLFIRNSAKYPLTGKGDINTYTIFSELSRHLINPYGKAGIIVPSGIATDATTAPFFSDLVRTKSLASLYDFENSKGLFPIHRSFKFCLLTMSGTNLPVDEFSLAFFLHTTEDMRNTEKIFTLSPEDIDLINPNTGNCPIFRSGRDAEITKAVYRRIPVLWREKTGENPWEVSFQTMFHMANDSGLFKTKDVLLEKGFTLEGNVFVNGDERYLPLYEAKMVWHYDHRFGDFAKLSTRASSNLPQQSLDSYCDTKYTILPWYWIKTTDFPNTLNNNDHQIKWLIGFRDVTNATNMRTLIVSIIPFAATNHKFPIILFGIKSQVLKLAFYANLNSIIADYIVRRKIGGVSMGYFILKQFPVIPPNYYSKEAIELICPKVVKLTYTANDLNAFGDEILKEIGVKCWNTWFPENPVKNGKAEPFIWNKERRFVLERELDAIYARMYGISKNDLSYILDTFPIVKENDVKTYGYFKTKEDILKFYDEYSDIQPYLP